MEIAIIAALSSLLGVTVGGIISYKLQKARFEQELQLKREENKTENVAEKTIRYYLKEEGHLQRSEDFLSTILYWQHGNLGRCEINKSRSI